MFLEGQIPSQKVFGSLGGVISYLGPYSITKGSKGPFWGCFICSTCRVLEQNHGKVRFLWVLGNWAFCT